MGKRQRQWHSTDNGGTRAWLNASSLNEDMVKEDANSRSQWSSDNMPGCGDGIRGLNLAVDSRAFVIKIIATYNLGQHTAVHRSTQPFTFHMTVKNKYQFFGVSNTTW